MNTRNFRTAKRWAETEAADALRAWKQSGKKLADFASAEGIEELRLQRWRRRLAKRLEIARPELLPVRVVADAAARNELRVEENNSGTAFLEVVLRNGRRVVVHNGFDAVALSRVLEIAESV